jgi:hypothetical protein
MREIVHMQAGQCGNQIGAKVCFLVSILIQMFYVRNYHFYSNFFNAIFIQLFWSYFKRPVFNNISWHPGMKFYTRGELGPKGRTLSPRGNVHAFVHPQV